MRGYDWGEVVLGYFGNGEVPCIDTIVPSTTTNNKQAETIFAQLIAMAWKVA